jgi:hypothetical protein
VAIQSGSAKATPIKARICSTLKNLSTTIPKPKRRNTMLLFLIEVHCSLVFFQKVFGSTSLVDVFPNMLQPYAPLDFTAIPRYLHALLDKYQKHLPHFDGDGATTAKAHLDKFVVFLENLDIMHEDVKMELFFKSLKGEARRWYGDLPTAYISIFVAFVHG